MPVIPAERRRVVPTSPELTPEVVLRALTPFVAEQRQRRIDAVIRRRLASVTVVMEHPVDPHNVAAMLRTSEALGLLDVHVVSDRGGLLLSPKVTKSAHKWLNIYLHRDTRTCLSSLREAGYLCWAAAPLPIGSTPTAARVEVDRPAALVFGSEHHGLSREALALCDARFSIPLYGFIESYNVSVAVGLALQDVLVRRRAHLGCEGDLSSVARDQLRAAYYARSVSHASPIVYRYISSG